MSILDNKYVNNFQEGSLSLKIKITHKRIQSITKTATIKFFGFETLNEFKGTIKTKLNTTNSQESIVNINENNFTHFFDTIGEKGLVNLTKDNMSYYNFDFEFKSKNLKEGSFAVLLKSLIKKDNDIPANVEIFPPKFDLNLEITISGLQTVNYLQDTIDELEKVSYKFSRKEITVDEQIVKQLSSEGLKELSNLGTNFDKLNNIIQTQFVEKYKGDVVFVFSHPRTIKSTGQFLIDLTIQWIGYGETNKTIWIGNYFPKEYEDILTQFKTQVTDRTFSVDKDNYSLPGAIFKEEINNASSNDLKLKVLKKVLSGDDYTIIEKALQNNKFTLEIALCEIKP